VKPAGVTAAIAAPWLSTWIRAVHVTPPGSHARRFGTDWIGAGSPGSSTVSTGSTWQAENKRVATIDARRQLMTPERWASRFFPKKSYSRAILE
jgi:hypothetical protein